MDKKILERASSVDENYFGNRNLEQILAVLFAQVDSLKKEQTSLNAQKQTGDILFVLISIARNMRWDMEQLLDDTVTKIENRRQNRHYYEAHITIEPVFDKRLEKFKEVSQKFKFHVATLLMQKAVETNPELSKNDSFCTGRSISYSDIETRMLKLVSELRENDFKVWRYKIESTLLDSRYDDSKLQLSHESLPEKETKPGAPADRALAGRKKTKSP